MKIIICTRDLTFGVGVYIRGLLKELDKNGEIEKVLVIGPEKLKGFSNKIQFSPFRLKGKFFITKEPIFALRCKKKIARILKKEKYDLIYTCFPFLIFEKFNIPFIAIFHGLHKSYPRFKMEDWRIKMAKIFHFLYSYFDYKTIQNAYKIAFVSNRTLREAKRFYPKYKNKFVYIPAFVDTSKFYPLNQIEKGELKRKYGLERNKKYILYVGRLEPLKGIELLIETTKELRKIINIELLVAGKGISSKKLKSYDFINYLGKIPNKKMNEVYNIADLFVLPSYYENCPLTVLEAMASGCFVLVSDVGDVGEIINNRQFIFNPGNKQELEEKIIKLLNLNQKEKGEITNYLIEKVKGRYNVKIITKRILDLYETVKRK